MEASVMKKILAIVSQCDALTITKEDMSLILKAIAMIIVSLKKVELATTEISAQWTVLKLSTWSEGYFCICVQRMVNVIWPVVDIYEVIAEAFNT